MTASVDDVRLSDEVERGAQGGPQFLTSVISLSGGTEQRVSVWEETLAPWDIGYGVSDMDTLADVEAFFYSRRGKARGFRFKDWHDFECTNEAIGTGDGTTRTFLFGKTYGATDPQPYFRRLTRIVDTTVNIYVNGVLINPANYDVGLIGGYVKFHAGQAPGNGLIVAYDCEFDIPVRFDVDDFKAVIYWVQAGEVPHLPVIGIRDIVNASPTVALANKVTTLPEDTSTVAHVKVADVVVTDDPFGTDTLVLSGADSAFFELVGTLTIDGTGVALYLRAATELDAVAKSSYAVTVGVKDLSLSTEVLDDDSMTLTITAVEHEPTIALSNLNNSFAWDEDTTSHIRVADVDVTQLHPSATVNTLTLTGADAADYELGAASGAGSFQTQLYIKAGTTGAMDAMSTVHYDVTVNVKNADFGAGVLDSADLTTYFGVDPANSLIDDVAGTRGYVVPEYVQMIVEGWGGGGGAPGKNTPGTDGTETHVTAMSLVAPGGKTPALNTTAGTTGQLVFNTEPGLGGVATGTGHITGNPGAPGFYQRRTSLASVASGAGGLAPGTGGGAAGAAATSTLPAAPYTADQCSPAPPQPYPVPGTLDDVDGGDGAGPGAGGAGASSMGWELILSLAAGYCWYPFAQARPGAGSGGYFRKVILSTDPGAPIPGATITYTVGAKGLGGVDSASGGDGGHARIKITVS